MTQSSNLIHEELLALYISFNTSHRRVKVERKHWDEIRPRVQSWSCLQWKWVGIAFDQKGTPVKRDLSWLIKTDAERIFFASKSHQSLSHSNSPSQNMNCQGCWMGLMHLASMLKRNQKTLLWVGVDKMLAEQLASSPFTYWRLCEKDERLWKIIFDSEWL